MASYVNLMLIKAKIAMDEFLYGEKGEVNVVAIVVLIAVAVVLALFFKDRIAEILGDLLDSIGGKAATAIDDV